MWNQIVAFFMSIISFFLGIFGLGDIMDKNYIELTDISYGAHERNVLDLYLPENAGETTGLVLCIHGGAWIAGDKSAYTSAAKDVCESYSLAAATINYRYLSETVTMADIIEDIDNAVTKIRQVASEHSVNIEKMILTGHSAGGHLSMLYAYSMHDTAAITPACVANYSGPTDLNDKNFFVNNDLGEDNVLMLLSYATGTDITRENFDENYELIAKTSPISYVNENTVPTIINHGMKDTVVPYSNAVSLDKVMTEYGVTHVFNTYPNSGHGLDSDKENDSYAYDVMLQYVYDYVLS